MSRTNPVHSFTNTRETQEHHSVWRLAGIYFRPVLPTQHSANHHLVIWLLLLLFPSFACACLHYPAALRQLLSKPEYTPRAMRLRSHAKHGRTRMYIRTFMERSSARQQLYGRPPKTDLPRGRRQCRRTRCRTIMFYAHMFLCNTWFNKSPRSDNR